MSPLGKALAPWRFHTAMYSHLPRETPANRVRHTAGNLCFNVKRRVYDLVEPFLGRTIWAPIKEGVGDEIS